MINTKLLSDIAVRGFNGNVIRGQYRGQGLRRGFLCKTLRQQGLKPVKDDYGNLWVERGTVGEPLIFSAHMDIDQTAELTPQFKARKTAEGLEYRGILDNAVGCYLNLEAAVGHSSDRRAFYIFTASEEEDPNDSDISARSAQDVVKVLKQRGIIPPFSVVVDVTYPELLVPAESLDEMYDSGQWTKTPAEQIFNFKDQTHCYLDGFDRGTPSEELAQRVIDMMNDPNIRLRNFPPGWDETKAYLEIAPAICVGPVGYGKYDEPHQRMPQRNVETVLQLLQNIANQR